MGMYTELVFKASIKTDLQSDVESILQNLFNDGGLPEKLPDHKFFTLPRWMMIGHSSSYYHVPWASSRYSDGYIFSRSDLKNYDSEIECFIDWIRQYIDEVDGFCIGWSWYEEDDTPTLLFK